MTIPPKYEDVVAELETEREMSASTLGELEDLVEKLNNALGENDSLQRRLTVAEQRAGELEGLLKGSLESVKFDLEKVESPEAEKYLVALIDGIEAALKPAAEGEGS